MEKLEHPLWIVEIVNADRAARAQSEARRSGYRFSKPAAPIPPFMVMVLLIVVVIADGPEGLIVPFQIERRESRQAPDCARRRLESGAGSAPSSGISAQGPSLPAADRPPSACSSCSATTPMGLIPGLMAPNEQHQRDAGLRAHDLGVLPLSGHRRERDRECVAAHFWAPPERAVVDRLRHVPRSRSSATRRASCRCRCGCSAASSAKSSSS